MARRPLQLLTHSRQDCFKSCRRKHYFAYELGLRRETDSRALRMGSAFHGGLECLGNRMTIDDACAEVYAAYQAMPDQFDAYEWEIERETVLRLLFAYEWRWLSSGIENVAAEHRFRLPLVNPFTGKRTPIFDLGGMIDGIVRLEDGRLAVKESKLLGEDISDDAGLWRRLRMDAQISLYMHAARQSGFPVETVLYDVTRKPSIAPERVALLDDDGLKVVLDAAGQRVRNANGKWRQTGDAGLGYVLQARPMTVEEWGRKLTDDITERPDFYFQRREIARLDSDIQDCQAELWEIQLAIREAQKTGRWYRTVGKNTCGFCPYFDICSTGQLVRRSDPPPPGFEFLDNVHPELGVMDHADDAETAAAETARQ